MNRKFLKLFLLLAGITFMCSIGCHHNYPDSNWKYKDGYVPNAASAIKIAEIVWLNVYGEEIKDEKPFIAKLKDGKVWIVEGTLSKYELGGVAHIEIQKSDGKILKVIHGK